MLIEYMDVHPVVLFCKSAPELAGTPTPPHNTAAAPAQDTGLFTLQDSHSVQQQVGMSHGNVNACQKCLEPAQCSLLWVVSSSPHALRAGCAGGTGREGTRLQSIHSMPFARVSTITHAQSVSVTHLGLLGGGRFGLGSGGGSLLRNTTAHHGESSERPGMALAPRPDQSHFFDVTSQLETHISSSSRNSPL